MRPINSVSSSPMSGGEVKIWKSPIPYLFGGLAAMLVLISVALVILVCSYKKRDSHSSPEAEDMKSQAMSMNNKDTNSEPEILVIMAGDQNPTYLAKPITSSIYCTCGVQPQPTPSSTQ
ncbi:Protein GLUTAMINE DUMPER 2, partial [Mucuna pruriens]